MTTNTAQLYKLEKESLKIKNGLTEENPALFENLDLEYSLNVVNVKTGQMGFAVRFDDDFILFKVPAEHNREYKFSNKEFDEFFLETPRKLVESFNFKSIPRFILNPYKGGVGVFLENEDKPGEPYSIAWEDGSYGKVNDVDLVWMTKFVAVQKKK